MSSTLWDHPDYIKLQPDWILYRDLYEGEHDVMSQPKYLWPYDIEGSLQGSAAGLYQNRQLRSRYTNISEMLVDIWNGLFFRREPTIPENVVQMFGDSYEDVDGEGTSFDSFIRDKMSISDLVYGQVITFVDSFASEAQTVGQAKADGQRPFLKLINPLDFRDWQKEASRGDRLNRFNFCRYEFCDIPPRASINQEPKLVRFSKALVLDGGQYIQKLYREVSEDDLKQNPKLKDLVSKNKNGEYWQLLNETAIAGMDELPIVVSSGKSWLKATSQIALRHYNIESALDNVNYYAAFPIKYFTGIESEQAKIALSAYTALFLPEGASAGMLEPQEPVALEKRLDQALDTFFKVGFKQTRQLSQDSKAAQSSESRNEERDNLIALIQARQERLESAINRSVENFARFQGKENFESKVELAHAITEQEIETLLKLYLSVRGDLERFKLSETTKQFVSAITSRAELSDPEAAKEEIQRGVTSSGFSQQGDLASKIEEASGDGRKPADRGVSQETRPGN